jgi:hypothetical protein
MVVLITTLRDVGDASGKKVILEWRFARPHLEKEKYWRFAMETRMIY